MSIARLTALTLLTVLQAAGACASGDPVFGFWLVENQRAVIELAPCGEKACGNIVWMKDPLDGDGQPKADGNNLDEELRGRLLCGIPLISDFKSDAPGVWSGGSIYSPRDGQTYSASMELKANDTLEIRGYLLLPVFGKTQIWTREADNRGGC